MPRKWSALALGAVLGAVAVAMPAHGAATQLGARAQLAGDGSSGQMQVRFTAQWLSPDGWVPLAGQASSPWLDAGSAEFTWQQAGWTFALNVPQTGEAYQLRAIADMKLGSGKVAAYTTGTCSVGG